MWMSSSGGQWETQIGDAIVGRVWVKDRFGLGAVGVNGYVLNCAGQARFTDAVQFMGTDKAISLNNGSYLIFLIIMVQYEDIHQMQSKVYI